MPRAARAPIASPAPTSATPEIEVARRGQRAVDDVPRRVVAAHRVDGDPIMDVNAESDTRLER